MKIAVYHNLPSGGALRSLQEYAKVLSKRGILMDLFIPSTANVDFMPLDDYTGEKHVFPLNNKRIDLKVPGLRKLGFMAQTGLIYGRLHKLDKKIAAIINEKYDLAFVHHTLFVQTPWILKYLEIPSVYFCQEINRYVYEAPVRGLEWPGNKLVYRNKMFMKIEKENMEAADLVLANSYFSRETILRTYGINAVVNYLGIDPEKFRPLGIEKENMVLSVGAFHPMKGMRFIVRSIGRIDKNLRPKLVIIGDRGNSEEVGILKKLALENDVDLETLSLVDDKTLVEYYNRAVLVVYAPYLEPFGLVPLEGMACGTPAVGVREGGVRESISHNETGLLVNRDENEFAEAVRFLITTPKTREEFGKNGIRVTREKWTWEKSTDRLLENFEKAIGLAKKQAKK
ncbi:MAG: glycosyltransferase family 4 protein [Chloroflexi bacterium]|nr:glycosyltransferase family 4 protein [Chloroflexota bacterium]